MKNKKGFTLIELLAVIVILAIIMVIASIVVNRQIRKAKVDSAISSATALKKTTQLYMINGGLDDLSIDFATDHLDLEIDGTLPSSGYYQNTMEGKEKYNLWYEKDKICVIKKENEAATGYLGVEKDACTENFEPTESR